MINLTKCTTKGDVGELRGLLAEARRQGKTRVILSMPVRLFAVDATYQTPVRTKRSLDYLVNNWDEAKLQPPLVVPHDEEGLIYLVDGYGRWKASQIVDAEKYSELEVLVVLNAPTEPKARQKYEAEQYAFQNRNVHKMAPVHKHGAMEILEDPGTLILNKMKEKYKFSYYNTVQGNHSEGVLGSYAETLKICSTRGEECMDYILRICACSGMHKKRTDMLHTFSRDLLIYGFIMKKAERKLKTSYQFIFVAMIRLSYVQRVWLRIHVLNVKLLAHFTLRT